MYRSRTDETRLAIARCAADLFWRNGLERTSGDTIAAAAGISTRTVWRHFRSKEACVEPLFLATALHLVDLLRAWPNSVSIEAYLRGSSSTFSRDTQAMQDATSAVRILALVQTAPALRSAWLMACAEAETEIIPIIAARAHLSPRDFDVKLCAAAIMAAIRVVDEDVSTAAVIDGYKFELTEPTDRLAAAIRRAATLPICDPV